MVVVLQDITVHQVLHLQRKMLVEVVTYIQQELHLVVLQFPQDIILQAEQAQQEQDNQLVEVMHIIVVLALDMVFPQDIILLEVEAQQEQDNLNVLQVIIVLVV